MKCRKCGYEIDQSVTACPNCGTKPSRPLYKRWYFWVILGVATWNAIFTIFLISLGVLGYSTGSNTGNTYPTYAQEPDPNSVIETVDDSVETTVAATEGNITEETVPVETTTIEETKPSIKIYSSGMYKVGSDLEAGEYFVYSTQLFSAYLAVATDSSGSLNSIVTNDNIDTFTFVTVSDGQYLTVTRGEFVKATDAEVPGMDENGNYGEGMYRVGIDIPAGEYKITPSGEFSTYIEVSKNSKGDLDDIITNENTSDPMYITVKDGQYLTVIRGTFTLA